MKDHRDLWHGSGFASLTRLDNSETPQNFHASKVVDLQRLRPQPREPLFTDVERIIDLATGVVPSMWLSRLSQHLIDQVPALFGTQYLG